MRGIFCRILLAPHDVVVGLSNVMFYDKRFMLFIMLLIFFSTKLACFSLSLNEFALELAKELYDKEHESNG